MAEIHLGVSPLSGAVYAGKLLKGGQVWAAGKQDVTNEFIRCALDKFGPDPRKGANESRTIITLADGTPEYEIIVKRIPPK